VLPMLAAVGMWLVCQDPILEHDRIFTHLVIFFNYVEESGEEVELPLRKPIDEGCLGSLWR
jgi:hypothetical protein